MLKLKEAQVKKVAKELNKVMGLNPPIDTDVAMEEIIKTIKLEVLQIGTGNPPLITPDDKFSDETTEVLNAFMGNGKDVPAEEATPAAVAEKIHKKNIADKPVQVIEDKPVTKKKPVAKVVAEKSALKEASEDLKNTAKAAVKKAKGKEEKGESNEALGVRLLKEKATDEEITEAFTAAYTKKDKNVTEAFVAKRVKIYMDIARKKTAKA
jgi:hypothetical protein